MISSSVFRLVATIHAKGNRKMSAAVTSSTCDQPRRTMYVAHRGARRARASALVIGHPLLAEPELRERQHEHRDEQDPRQRRRVPHAEVLKRLLEEVVRVKERRVRRPAV